MLSLKGSWHVFFNYYYVLLGAIKTILNFYTSCWLFFFLNVAATWWYFLLLNFTHSSVICTQENKETGMERVIDSVALFKWVSWIKVSSKALDWSVCNPVWNVLYRKPGVTGRGLYKLRPECAKMFNLYFHHYSRADQSKVRCMFETETQKERLLKTRVHVFSLFSFRLKRLRER